jgi:hypothetical protein
VALAVQDPLFYLTTLEYQMNSLFKRITGALIFASLAAFATAQASPSPFGPGPGPTPPSPPYTSTVNPTTLPALPALYLGQPVIVEFLGNIAQPGVIQQLTTPGYVGTTPMPEQVTFYYTTSVTNQTCAIFQTQAEAVAAYAYGGVGACVGWINPNLF